MSDLFSTAADDRRRAVAPLPERLRPDDLELMVGQEALIGPGRPLRRAIEEDRIGSMILFGSFLGWAVYDRIAVKRRGDLGAPPAPFGKGDVIALAVGTVAFLAMLKLHGWLIGVSIFG